jgi:hypothetical protein
MEREEEIIVDESRSGIVVVDTREEFAQLTS